MSTDHKAYAFDWNGFAAAEGTGLEAPARYIWLGPRWYAWLEFGPDNRHVTFMAIGARVASELGGRLEEYLPNPSDDGKEYAKVVVGEACLLLMRKAGIGAALGAEYRDLPLLLRIATLYGAERRGWRWPLYQLWQRVAGRGQDAEPGAGADRGPHLGFRDMEVSRRPRLLSSVVRPLRFAR